MPDRITWICSRSILPWQEASRFYVSGRRFMMTEDTKYPLKQNNGSDQGRDLLKGKDIVYYRDVVKLISSIEQTLRTYRDPEEVLDTLLEMTCDFYAADWTGAIDIDFDLGIWSPVRWYSRENGAMGKTLVRPFEPTEDYTSWIQAYKEQHIVFFVDIDYIRIHFPKEYESYLRMQVKSLMAAPYYKGTNGFLVVKNARRYVHETSLVQIMAYFVATEINDIRLIQNCLSHQPSKMIQDERDVLIRYFGGLSIETMTGLIPAKDLGRKESARVIALLGLHPAKAIAPYRIVDALYPNADYMEEIVKIRYNIYNFRRTFSYALDGIRLVISTENGYMLNPDLHIITDLQLFEEAAGAFRNVTDSIPKTKLLRQALNLYTDPIFPLCSGEDWLVQTELHYERLYGEMADQYCRILCGQKDYGTICDFAEEALRLDNTRPEIYYWIIYAQLKKNYRKAARKELLRARKNIDEESYQQLLKHLRRHFPNLPVDNQNMTYSVEREQE
jgi:DNA-binding SARP family transcriptional activator